MSDIRDPAIPLDTTPDADRVQAEVFRAMTGAQRVAMAAELSENMRQHVLSGIRARHPEYSEDQVQLEWFRLTLDPDTYEKYRVWHLRRPA